MYAHSLSDKDPITGYLYVQVKLLYCKVLQSCYSCKIIHNDILSGPSSGEYVFSLKTNPYIYCKES